MLNEELRIVMSHKPNFFALAEIDLVKISEQCLFKIWKSFIRSSYFFLYLVLSNYIYLPFGHI